jgi:catechol 2,3-dioxygenase-like lactoylglutathione lyase family enzyme
VNAATVKVWYHVADLDAACSFYTDRLGFTVDYVDAEARWARLQHGAMEVGVAEGDPQPDGGVAVVDVVDVMADAERLRAAGIEVGVVLELHGQMRLLDVFDPDGNRIQLAQELAD